MKTNGVTPATTNGTASSATAFYITANANIYDATNNDQWAMDQNKNLTHPADGIP